MVANLARTTLMKSKLPTWQVILSIGIVAIDDIKLSVLFRFAGAGYKDAKNDLTDAKRNIPDNLFRYASKLSDGHPIHLQWVPSHVGLLGNEVEDDLAKAATSNPVDPEDHMVLT
ncbi:hypothetical protein TNCV_808711 [Trichonephila clavipes]|nr:hypothetical protein TNCV_808711 [Trichonephila clavipes]